MDDEPNALSDRSRRKRRRSRPPRRHGRSRPSLTPALAALAIALVLAPQLLGGALPWAAVAVSALGVAAGAVTLWALRARLETVHVTSAGAVLALAVAWTAMQLVPLPASVAAFLAPESVEASAATADALGEGSPGWVPISRAPGETRGELLEGTALLAVFLAAYGLAWVGQRRRVAQIVAGSVLLMALVALGHALTGAERVFGLYEPRFAAPRLLAPLVNENNLAGFLVMGFPVLVTLGLDGRSEHRALWVTAAAVTGATALLTLSRGGIAALVGVGVLLTALLVLRRYRRREEGRSGSLLILGAATVAGALGLGAYVAADAILSELLEGDADKLGLLGESLEFAIAQPWVGVGRGAFSAAFVADFGATRRFVYAEHLPAQWIAEWGLPLGVTLLGVLGATLLRALTRSRSLTKLGAVVGCLGIAGHNLMDFGLELGGVALVAAALLGAGLAPEKSRLARGEPKRLPLRPMLAGAVAAGLVLTLALGPTVPGVSVRTLEDELVRTLRAEDRAGFRETLEDAVRLHPSEPSFALLAGVEASAHGDPAAPRWLNRAMALAPGWPSPRVEAARWLFAQGRRDQALLELREAGARDPGSVRSVLCDMLGDEPSAELAARAAPEGENRVAVLRIAAACARRHPEVAAAIDALILDADPTDLEAEARNVRRQLARGEHAEAARAARALLARHPADSRAQVLGAETLVASGDPAEALASLERAESGTDDLAAVLRGRARAEAAAGDVEAMRETVERLRGRAAGSARDIAAAWWLLGGLEHQLGNRGAALHAFAEAHRIQPQNARLARIAALARELGDLRRAFAAYAELCAAEPDHPRWCALKDDLLGAGGAEPRGPTGQQLLGAP